MLVRDSMERGTIPIVIFRPGCIYGPGDTRFLKLFRSIQRGRFPMIGKGDVYYHMTYIDDLINGILLCGQKPQAIGETFLLLGEGYVRLRDSSIRSLVCWRSRRRGSRFHYCRCMPFRSRSKSPASFWGSIRRCTGGGWTSFGRAEPSTSARPSASSGSHREST